MIVIRLDRRVLWGIVAVLLILVALAAGVLIGSMTGGGGATAAVPQAPAQQAPAQQAPLQQPQLQPQAQAQQPQAPTNLPMISIDEARQLLGQPNVVFVDARVVDQYKQQHIKGAISMPNTEVAQRYQELPRDKDLIIYCAWPNEQESAREAQILMLNGFTRVKVLKGGIQSWQQANLPMGQ